MDDTAREGIYLKICAIQNQLMILAGKSCFLSPLKAKPGFFKIMIYCLKNGLHIMLAHGSTDKRWKIGCFIMKDFLLPIENTTGYKRDWDLQADGDPF